MTTLAVDTALATGLQILTPREKCLALEFTCAVTAGYSAGDVVKVGAVVGIIYGDVALAATAVLLYKIPRMIAPCDTVGTSTATHTVGQKLWYNSATGKIRDAWAVTGDLIVGTCHVTNAVADTTVEMEWDGTIDIGGRTNATTPT